jgi:hypothetical protein
LLQVKVGSLLHNGGYLKQSTVRLEDPAIVLSGLKEPIPRPVLDAVIRFNDVTGFLALLGKKLPVYSTVTCQISSSVK